MALHVLLRKELLELWRTRRFLVLGAVFAFFGLLGPITAQLTPELIKLAGASAPGVVIQVPAPTVADAIAQYVKNLSQILPVAVLLVAMGSMTGERERGTLPMVLAKPVPRAAILAAKYLGLVVMVAVSLILGAVAAYYYTVLLFGAIAPDWFVLMNLIAGLFLLVVLSLTFLASTVAPSTAAAGALGFAAFLLLAFLSALPRVGVASPANLLGWAARVGLGQTIDAPWASLVTSVGIIGLCLIVAWLCFSRQEW
ncbi:MAG: ABC transporter permease [Anaerolineae bacterium]